MGDSRYKDNLTTLAKRLRPLLLSIAEGAMNANEWDNIILIVADGGGSTYYPATGAGLTSALGNASSGDVIYLPSGTFSGNQTVGSGVTVFGFGWNSIISGTVTNNGIVGNLKIAGNLVIDNSSVATGCYIEATSGNAVAITEGVLEHCDILLNGCNWGIYANNANVGEYIFIGWTRVANTGAEEVGENGVYFNSPELRAIGLRVEGYLASQIENCYQVSNSQFAAVYTHGVTHTAGTARLVACDFITQNESAAGYGVNLAAGGVTMVGCAWDTINGEANLAYGLGDRGAYSVEDYHAADIEAAALLRHLPSPVGEDDNDIAYVDTNLWVVGSAADAGITDDDEKVGVSANDSTPGYLNGKLVAGTSITLTEGSDGGDETLTIAVTGGATSTDSYWEPAVDADGDDIMFTDDGDIAMVWVS